MVKTHTCNGIEGITGKVVEFRGMKKNDIKYRQKGQLW